MSKTIAKLKQTTDVNTSNQFVANDIAYNEVLSLIMALKGDATDMRLTEPMRRHAQVTLMDLDDELGRAVHYVDRRLDEAKGDAA